jgi:hypothetical protein
MSITLIVGHIGSGKTHYQSKLVDEARWVNPTVPIYINYNLNLKQSGRYYILNLFRIPKKIYNFFTKQLPWISKYLLFSCIETQNPIIKFTNIGQLKNVRKAIICVDEMGAIFPAREWKNTPTWFLQKVAVSRHEGIDIIGTTQQYDGVDKNIRTLTEFVFWTRKYFNGKIFKISRVEVHPVLGTIEIKWFNWIFGTKKSFARYNSWSDEAITTGGGTKRDYIPENVSDPLEKINFS